MHVYSDEDLTEGFYRGGIRAHPWTNSTSNPSQRYVNFKRQPDLIESALEDFAPFREVPSVQSFFALLRHINRPDGLLETNDCGGKPVVTNVGQDGFGAVSKFRGSGRLMILFRNWWSNMNDDYTLSMHDAFGNAVWHFQTNARAVIGLAYCPIGFDSLPGSPSGRQIAIHWWIWGDTPGSTWAALADVCAAIRAGVDAVEAGIRHQTGPRMAPDAPGQPFSEPE